MIQVPSYFRYWKKRGFGFYVLLLDSSLEVDKQFNTFDVPDLIELVLFLQVNITMGYLDETKT